MGNIEIIVIGDGDSYKTMWVNGVRVAEDTDNLTLEDGLRIAAKAVGENWTGYNFAEGCGVMTIRTSTLGCELSSVDIPKDANTWEALNAWHREVAGTDLPRGF